MKYVIIGNGVASIGAIEGIRKHDAEGKILVISEEDKATYGRPLISYYLAGKVDESKMALRPESFYADNNVEVMLSTRVASIDTAAKSLTLSNGDSIEYEQLLLVTGGAPGMLNIPGKNAKGVHVFTTWAHADALKADLETANDFVVIGAGLIALKAAEALVQAGKNVTLMVRSRIMRTYFDETAGGLIMKHLEKQGLNFLHGATPDEICEKDGKVCCVKYADGEIKADAVIMATGVYPASELAKEAGITVNKGIVCQDSMQTSAENVYAAGDVAEARDLLSGNNEVSPIWPSAYNQGVIAGINMAGTGMASTGSLSMNSVTLFKLPTISVGTTVLPEGHGYEVVEDIDEDAITYRKLVFDGNSLLGCILIGDIDNAGVYTSFIQNKLELDEEGKQEIIKGAPSPLLWPSEFFDRNVLQPATKYPILG